MSREDFSKMLADIWILTEAPNLDPNFKQKELLDLFQIKTGGDDDRR